MIYTKQLINLSNTLRTHSITCTLDNHTLHLPELKLSLESSSQTTIYDSQFNIVARFKSIDSVLRFILEMNKLKIADQVKTNQN
jgi:hypothetical protein